jgi:hypothetical protein
MRTTMVPTIISAGVAMNVVPMHSEITVDMRNLPGDVGNTPLCFVKRAVEFAGLQVSHSELESQRCSWAPAIDVTWALGTVWKRLSTFGLKARLHGSHKSDRCRLHI